MTSAPGARQLEPGGPWWWRVTPGWHPGLVLPPVASTPTSAWARRHVSDQLCNFWGQRMSSTTKRSNRTWPRRLPLTAIIALIVPIMIVALTQGMRRGRPGNLSTSKASQGQRVVSSAVRYSTFMLPKGYAQPAALAAAGPSGVWVAAASQDGTALFLNDPTHGVQQRYPVRCPTSGSPIAGLRAQLAVSSTGTVWLGANQTLVRLQPATGTADCLELPPIGLNPTARMQQPPQVRGYAEIEGTTVTPDGSSVAVGRANATSVEMYDVPAGTWHQLSLPTGDAMAAVGHDVSYLADGRLLVAVHDWSHARDSVLLGDVHGFEQVGTAKGPAMVTATGQRLVL